MNTKTFLLGGSYNRKTIDGFHFLTKPDEFPENFKNFDAYKNAIEFAVSEYALDEKTLIAINRSEGGKCFDMPSDSEIKEWMQEFFQSKNE